MSELLTHHLCARDLDKDGQVEPKDLPKMCKAMGETWSYEQVMETFRAGKPANPSQVTTEDFLKVLTIIDHAHKHPV